MGRKKKYFTDEERKNARKEYFKNYYQKHKKEMGDNSKKYYQAHKEEIAEYNFSYQTEYRKEHKAEIAAYQTEYYKNNKDSILKQQAEYRSSKIGRANKMAESYYIYDKKHNSGECTVDAQWIVDNIFSGQVCHYCGETDWRLLGCDRIDNSKSHTEGNVVCCCKDCNLKRNRTPYDEFMKRIGKIT